MIATFTINIFTAVLLAFNPAEENFNKINENGFLTEARIKTSATAFNENINPLASDDTISKSAPTPANAPKASLPLLKTGLKLPQESLEKLGISSNNAGVTYEGVVKDLGYLKVYFNNSSGYGVTAGGMFKMGKKHYTFYPLFVTKADGEMNLRYKLKNEHSRKMEDGYFSEVMNKLVPVLVETAAGEMLFWYLPNDEFNEIIAAGLKPEKNKTAQAVDEKDSGEEMKKVTEPADANALIDKAEMDVLLALKDSNGIEMNVFPNPANEKITVTMNLPKDALVNLVLYTLDGKVVQDYNLNKNLSVGQATLDVNLPRVPNGIYLLYLVLDNNSFITTKLVVTQ